ncbi:outer membrane beta-barrel protein [Sphingomonas cavernae]|uniref:outer membrane beta-barrel protein n=1 Tax=Sphingomonas cavernae TaxID=2320861 RepID=UPI0015FFCDAE|nr:outer membrane beta-barrel protein [Sphingomonas cavernae]
MAVRDRPQPLYDPVPYRIDGIEVMPRVSADATYDSNIFATSDAIDDLMLRVRPRMTASALLGSLDVTSAVELDRREYLSHGNQSTTDVAFGLAGRYTISRDTQIYAGTRNGRRTEDRADPDSPLNLRAPVQYDYVTGYLGAAHSFNRLRIAGRIGVEDRDYQDGRDGLGNLVDQDFRSRTLLTSDIAAEYAFSPDTSAFVNVTFNERNYPAQSLLEPSRDSNGYRITTGANFELTKVMRGQVGLGYFRQDFESPAYDTVKGLAARAKLEYFMTPLLTWTLNANRGVEEASTIGTGAYVATSASLQADYEVFRNLILSAGANYEHDDFQDIDRRYDIWGAMLAADYKLGPRYALRMQYDFRDQDAAGTFPGREFARHRLMAGVTMQGM